jgi:cobalt/nickel transport system permease protein
MTVLGLWAVHISDNVLTESWCVGGFVGAALLALLGAWRIRDEEIPRVALLTAAFFVASQIHVPLGVFSTVHLLLNGLLGVVLGMRAGLAIPVGLFLQVALFQHGGYTTLGINTCIMALPALLAWQLFALLRRVPWVRQPAFRAGLVALSALMWTIGLVFSLALLASNPWGSLSNLDLTWANYLTFHPLTLTAASGLALGAAWAERRLGNAPEFPLGLLVGELAVLATTFLNCFVLVAGGKEDWPSLVLLTLIPHLFIAVIEGVVLGFTVGFLVKVKPEMLGWTVAKETECLVDSIP